MLEALHAAGVGQAVIVVGHCADQVPALAASAPPGMAVRRVVNPGSQAFAFQFLGWRVYQYPAVSCVAQERRANIPADDRRLMRN